MQQYRVTKRLHYRDFFFAYKKFYCYYGTNKTVLYTLSYSTYCKFNMIQWQDQVFANIISH